MKTTVVGSYPKIASGKSNVNLRRAIHDAEKGKITDDALETAYRETILRTIRDQEAAGIDVITDGQIRWQDLTDPLATSLVAVQPGGLRRFYDNNVYYRRPQIIDSISRNTEIVTEEYRFAAANSERPVKAVLCGPITLCALSDNYYYKSFEKLANAIADVLAEEINSLTEAGCRHIQLDEPSLPLFPGRMPMAAELYRRIFAGAEGEYGVFVYFTSIASIAAALPQMPVSFIGLDLVSHPGDMELLAGWNKEMTLVAGLFDGRNIMLENEKRIREIVTRLATILPLDKIVLSPSCGLEFLPQKHAVAKMKRLSEVAAKLS